MSTRQRRRSLIRPLIVPAICIGFSGYFVWHAWHGAFGIEARRAVDIDTKQVAAQVDGLKQERATLERRVTLLRAQSLESDMLDERVREILGFAQPNELVIYSSRLPKVASLTPAR